MLISSRYISLLLLLALLTGAGPDTYAAEKQLTPRQLAALMLIFQGSVESIADDEEDVDFDIEVDTGTTLLFDVSGAVGPSGQPLSFTWTVTSQPVGSQIEFVDADSPTPAITFVLPGAYQITLTATDGQGYEIVDSAWVNVTSPTPVAILTPLEAEPVVGLPFAFDGSASYQPDDIALSYQWSLLEQPLNSGMDPLLGNGPQIEVVFDQAGSYTLRLTVSDGTDTSNFDLSFEVGLYDTFPLSVGFADAEFDPVNERIVTLLDEKLSLITGDGEQVVIQLPLDGQTVAVSPDGAFAAVGHDGWISHVNLDAREVLNTHPVAADILDLVLDDSGIAHAFPRGQSVRPISVDMETGQVISSARSIFGNTRVRLHAAGDRIYGAHNLSPSDLERYDIDPVDYSISYAYDSPYHGDYPFCGDLWMHPEGEIALSRCRVVVRTTDFQQSDLTFVMQLPEGASSQIQHASVDGFSNAWLIIDRQTNFGNGGVDSVRTVDAVTGVERERYYTPFQSGLDSSRWNAMFVFGQSDSVTHFVLTVDDTDNPQAYALLISRSPPAVNSNLAPTARVQRYSSVRQLTPVQLDASASSDPEGEPLSFTWRGVAQPAGSGLDLSSLRGETLSFIPDAAGTYEFELQANDGVRNSRVVRATVNAFSPSADLVHRLEGEINDVEYSKSLNSLVLVDGTQLRIIRLSDLSEQQLELALPGYRVGLSPDGSFAAVSHAASVSLVSLSNLSVVDTQDYTEDWGDVVLDHNNIAHLVPNRDQWSNLISLNFATDEIHSLRGARADTRLRMHPIENWVYGADVGVSPSDFEKWNVDTFPPTSIGDSPYHGDFNIGGNIWISEDADRAVVAGGNTFNLSSDSAIDMTYSGGVDDGLRVQWADHSTEVDTWAVVSGQGADAKFMGSVLLYSDQFFNLIESRPIADIPTASGGAANVSATHVFFADDGNQIFVILQGEGVIDRYAVQLIDLSQ